MDKISTSYGVLGSEVDLDSGFPNYPGYCIGEVVCIWESDAAFDITIFWICGKEELILQAPTGSGGADPSWTTVTRYI